jgi:hypothetical protein
MYQVAIKYTKSKQNRSKGHKVCTHLPFQDSPKFTQSGIFGLKIYHLATLAVINRLKRVSKKEIWKDRFFVIHILQNESCFNCFLVT